MESSNKVGDTLKYYPVFRLVDYIIPIKRLGVSWKFLIVTICITVFVLVGSTIDKTLIMKGPDIGLFQHPAIWTFLIGQVIACFSVSLSVKRLYSFFEKNEVLESQFNLKPFKESFIKNAKREKNIGRTIFILLTTIGFVAFIWNSFQNQLPQKYLGFDFWDSINHLCGYWITRGYKLFLWVMVIPCCAHLQLLISITLYQLLKEAEGQKLFKLKPYHLDGYGGASTIINIAINAFIPILIISFISVLAVLLIHCRLGLTPVMGIFILSFLFAFTYLVPAIALNRIIKKEKKRQLAEVTAVQNLLLQSITTTADSSAVIANSEAINGMEVISKQIKKIPNWPHITTVIQLIGLINIPTVISFLKMMSPLLTSILPILIPR
jgi:hypothetical protein